MILRIAPQTLDNCETPPNVTLYDDFKWRGLIHQTTHDELPQLLEKERFTLYCGFDPTADSLHIGTLVPIVSLMRFQRAGHTPIVLVGGATGMIGDPSGKSEERQLLTRDYIEHNVAKVEIQLRRFLDFSGSNAAIVVNNADWLSKVRLVTFMRDVGKHFSVNQMIARESVRARLEDREHGISYTEFSYQLLQAYDFLQLYDEYQCRLQVGASDQWGNIVAGMDLTRRMREGISTFGLTFPLLTKAGGSKFGKTESGNVWLDPAKTSPYKFYQFWLNASDDDAPKLLRYFTFLEQNEIEELDRQIEAAPQARAAQKRLAEEVTRLVHGDTALQQAVDASRAMFGGDLSGLDEATLEDVFSEVPSTDLPKSDLGAGKFLVDVLVDAGVFPSKGEAKRMVKNGGLYLNNERVDEAETKLGEQSICTGRIAVVRKGKKNYHLLRFV